MTRLGHGPFPWFFGYTWPQHPIKWLLYDSRPDLLTSKTRAPEWKKLNTHWRYVHALLCYLGPPSHVLWNIRFGYLFIVVITVMAVVWQALHNVRGFIDIDSHGTFTQAFRLTSFIMSLLLAFRLNRTYDRWNLARASIAGVGSGATSVFLQAATWIKDNPRLVDDFRRFCIVWPYSIKQTVTSAKKLDPAAEELLCAEERAVFYGSRKGRQVVVTKIRAMAHSANLPLQQFTALESSIAMTWKSAGDALRIKFQAMPHAVGLMCTGFVLIWCCLLPFSLVINPNRLDWTALCAMLVVALLLLGIDEVTTQLEDPFDLMPLDEFTSTSERDINRVLAELESIQAATTAAHLRIDKEKASSGTEEGSSDNKKASSGTDEGSSDNKKVSSGRDEGSSDKEKASSGTAAGSSVPDTKCEAQL